MYEYRQVPVRLRQGDSDCDVARSRLMGRRQVAEVRQRHGQRPLILCGSCETGSVAPAASWPQRPSRLCSAHIVATLISGDREARPVYQCRRKNAAAQGIRFALRKTSSTQTAFCRVLAAAGRICALDAAGSQINNPRVAANSATGFCSPIHGAHSAAPKAGVFLCPEFMRRRLPISGDGVRGAARLAGPWPVCKPAHRSPPFSPFRVATPRKGSCPWKIGLQLAALSRVVVPLSALAALFPASGGARHDPSRFVLSHAPRCAVG